MIGQTQLDLDRSARINQRVIERSHAPAIERLRLQPEGPQRRSYKGEPPCGIGQNCDAPFPRVHRREKRHRHTRGRPHAVRHDRPTQNRPAPAKPQNHRLFRSLLAGRDDIAELRAVERLREGERRRQIVHLKILEQPRSDPRHRRELKQSIPQGRRI